MAKLRLISTAATCAVFAIAGVVFAQKNQFPWNDFHVEDGITTIHVQGNVYMIHGLGGNVAVQTGDTGVLVVNTGLEQNSARLIAAVRKLSDRPAAVHHQYLRASRSDRRERRLAKNRSDHHRRQRHRRHRRCRAGRADHRARKCLESDERSNRAEIVDALRGLAHGYATSPVKRKSSSMKSRLWLAGSPRRIPMATAW